jgi:hypothetical protein
MYGVGGDAGGNEHQRDRKAPTRRRGVQPQRQESKIGAMLTSMRFIPRISYDSPKMEMAYAHPTTEPVTF